MGQQTYQSIFSPASALNYARTCSEWCGHAQTCMARTTGVLAAIKCLGSPKRRKKHYDYCKQLHNELGTSCWVHLQMITYKDNCLRYTAHVIHYNLLLEWIFRIGFRIQQTSIREITDYNLCLNIPVSYKYILLSRFTKHLS